MGAAGGEDGMTRTLDQLRDEVLAAVQQALARTTGQFTAHAGGQWYAARDVPGVRVRLHWAVEETATSHQPSLFGAVVGEEDR